MYAMLTTGIGLNPQQLKPKLERVQGVVIAPDVWAMQSLLMDHISAQTGSQRS